MKQSEMFERSFERPKNYFELSSETKWAIDKSLGILDWDGGGSNGKMTPDERKRYEDHYDYYREKRKTMKTREQELREELAKIQQEKTRMVAPETYDWMQANGFDFEGEYTAYKALNDDFEIKVVIFHSESAIIMTFIDRSCLRVVNNRMIRHEVYPAAEFRGSNIDSRALEFLKNPTLPTKYRITYKVVHEYYVMGDLNAAREHAKDVAEFVNPRESEITVEEL